MYFRNFPPLASDISDFLFLVQLPRFFFHLLLTQAVVKQRLFFFDPGSLKLNSGEVWKHPRFR